MKKTGYIFHPTYLKHDTEPHPENPRRLEAIDLKVRSSDIYKDLILPEPRKATEDEIAENHHRAHIENVRTSCAEGVRHLDGDTVICPDSYEAALLSAGAGLTAVDQVIDGDCDNVFAAVRPPGHHAEFDHAMGFCLFNNVAVAARYAIKKKGLNRVFIFDWDVHHGNGTQHSFYSDPSVYYSSTHQYPFYPGTGASDETGSGDGLGATLNFPMEAFSGDSQYIDAVENKLIPEMFRYKPDLIIVSAGFDAHKDDPLAQVQVSTEGYGRMTELISRAAQEICQGRLISMLEGGYNPDALSDSVLIHLKTLMA
ncbi:MAG: histone deacetylase [Nitrospinaceae bacterium]